MASLQALREDLHVSISQLKTYLRCPRSYELRYVRGLPPAFIPVAMAFGSAIHGALAHHYRELKTAGKAPSPDVLVEVFRDLWAAAQDGPIPLQSEDEDRAVDHVERGAAMLAAFHRTASMMGPVEVEDVEAPFSIELHDPVTGEALEERLVGAFDLVVKEGDQRVVVEHKTGARRWSADQLENDIQMTAYRCAASQIGLGEVGLRLQILTKGRTPAIQIEDVLRTDLATRDLLETVVAVLRAVDVGAFYPMRSTQCRTCPYLGPCIGGLS